MSIYVVEQTLPHSCMCCPWNRGEKRPEYGWSIFCPFSNGVKYPEDMDYTDDGINRLPKCGIYEVAPHGRLIDADALEKSLVVQIEQCIKLLELLKCDNNIHDIANQCGVLEEILEEVKNAPTIIPTDKEVETDV